MAARRLDLRINDLPTKQRWLQHLSSLLRDAQVLGDGRWDVRRMRYEVELERICYESGRSNEYPSITCRLAVTPVLSCVDGRDGVAESWVGETLTGLELRDRHELALVSSYGATRLRLGAGANLEIQDVGQPNEHHLVCDYGHAGVDLRRANELMRLRVV
ncbi:MAG: hypothetical protein AAGM22_07260 [Acidobacteriota bacterium]